MLRHVSPHAGDELLDHPSGVLAELVVALPRQFGVARHASDVITLQALGSVHARRATRGDAVRAEQVLEPIRGLGIAVGEGRVAEIVGVDMGHAPGVAVDRRLAGADLPGRHQTDDRNPRRDEPQPAHAALP